MIHLYITEPDNVEMCNDEFFVSKTYRKIIENTGILKLINEIEGVEIKNNEIISKFTGEILHLNSLSTGCKTLLNILAFPEKIFFIGECGDNVLERIYGLKNISLYASNIYLPVKTVSNNIIVHYDDETEQFSDTSKLYDWWCKYNESESEDDD